MFRIASEDLGRLVGEWFPFGKHLMLGVYQTVRTFEETARQRASLIALGTLSAGLAHEINNPAAASLRAVEALRENCDKMLLSLGKLGEMAITAEQSVELARLPSLIRLLARHGFAVLETNAASAVPTGSSVGNAVVGSRSPPASCQFSANACWASATVGPSKRTLVNSPRVLRSPTIP